MARTEQVAALERLLSIESGCRTTLAYRALSLDHEGTQGSAAMRRDCARAHRFLFNSRRKHNDTAALWRHQHAADSTFAADRATGLRVQSRQRNARMDTRTGG